jgi:hypothetical protein
LASSIVGEFSWKSSQTSPMTMSDGIAKTAAVRQRPLNA